MTLQEMIERQAKRILALEMQVEALTVRITSPEVLVARNKIDTINAQGVNRFLTDHVRVGQPGDYQPHDSVGLSDAIVLTPEELRAKFDEESA